MLRRLGTLRGLRVQLLLWLALPLTLALAAVAIISVSVHQRSMRQMVEELDARSARLAAAHLTDELATRATFLDLLADGQELTELTLGDSLERFFDGGLARFDAAGRLVEAVPLIEDRSAWPAAELFAPASLVEEPPAAGQNPLSPARFSRLFIDPRSGRPSLLISSVSVKGSWVVGAVSLERLGVTQIMRHPEVAGQVEPETVQAAGHSGNPARGEAIAFLVDAAGQVIYHPDPAMVGQDLKEHEGVEAVIQGRAGATYHQEPDGRELAVGYAPVAGPGWGLIVQEPWEALVAPTMRLSLLAPLVVVAAALISSLAVTFGLRYVVHPLQLLDRQATRLAWGDFAAVGEPVGGVQEIEDLRRTLVGMADQVQRYQVGMRDYIAAVTLAQEEERKRLARELHDETVQALIALGQRIEMAQKALDRDPAKARQRLAELRALADEAQAEVRRFSRALRPLYLEDLGFTPALEMLAQEIEREYGLPVSVRTEGALRRLAPDLELTAYRIAQEGLSNIIRHAEAQNAWLTITFAGDHLTLTLRDDGCGFEPPLNPADLAQTGHFGLMGIRERALLFGGRLEIRSKPGEGTTLQVFLPLDNPLDL